MGNCEGDGPDGGVVGLLDGRGPEGRVGLGILGSEETFCAGRLFAGGGPEGTVGGLFGGAGCREVSSCLLEFLLKCQGLDWGKRSKLRG